MSRIADVEARAIGPPVERFRYTSFQPEVFTTTTLVRITDEDGVAGIGAYDSDTYGDWDRAPLETLRTLIPPLIGIDAEDRNRVAAMLNEDGTSPFPPAVRSTVDIALWDLAARRAGEPLRRILGPGRSDALPSYASIPTFDAETDYLSAIEGQVQAGFGAIKVHAWGDPDRDAALLRAIRSAFGSLKVMHDAEGRYDADGALGVARVCAEIGARWFEAPLPDFDLPGYRALRRAVQDVPILPAGDAVWDPRLLRDILRDPPWDAVRFDVSFVGGPTPTSSLMEVAAEAGLSVELTSYGHTVIQAANLHAALAFERTSFFEQAVPPEPFEYGVTRTLRTGEDGCIDAPDGAGIGVELDPEALQDVTLGVVRAGQEG